MDAMEEGPLVGFVGSTADDAAPMLGEEEQPTPVLV